MASVRVPAASYRHRQRATWSLLLYFIGLMLLEGWGIHASPRGGWVWNLWDRQCVVLNLRHGVLRVGSDEADQLAAFLHHRIADLPRQS